MGWSTPSYRVIDRPCSQVVGQEDLYLLAAPASGVASQHGDADVLHWRAPLPERREPHTAVRVPEAVAERSSRLCRPTRLPLSVVPW
jgi:hypothetical protein